MDEIVSPSAPAGDATVIQQLRKELHSARNTIDALMDRAERSAAQREVTGLNLSTLALQQLVRQRTLELQRMNDGLMECAIQRHRDDRILLEMQRIAQIGGWELDVERNKIDFTIHVQSMFAAHSATPPTGASVSPRLTIAQFCALFSTPFDEMLKTKLESAATMQEPFDLELTARISEAAQGHFRVVGHPLVEGVRVTRVYGVIMDVTLQRMQEMHLAQVQRLESIGQLAAGIAHEINTPTQYVGDNIRFLTTQFDAILALIRSRAALLQGEPISWEDQKQRFVDAMQQLDFDFVSKEIPLALAQSIEGIERVGAIVRAMKDFSHPGSTAKEMVDLNRSILSTIEVSRSRWKYCAEMQTDLQEDLPRTPCLIGEFNQVILNLIVNAADAIAENHVDGSVFGKIKVSTRLLDKWVEIRVADNGPGIPASIRPRLFEPFFTTKPVGKGTGQGLAISRNAIVNKHGGELSFETTEGLGTTFIVRLPLADQSSLREVA